jgi:hypothetical protein
VTEDSRRIPPAPCPGDPHNCELLLSSQEAYRGRGAQAEILYGYMGAEKEES